MPETRASAGVAELLRLKREYLLPCAFHFYERPPVIVAAEDCELIDDRGRRYLDMLAGVTVVNAGHCNAAIRAAVAEQMRRLDHTTSIYLTEPVLRLAERLAETLPSPLRRSFFCVSGSEANEGALLLAAMHTGRSEFIAVQGSLHGRTRAALGVTGLDMWRIDPFPPLNCHHVPGGWRPDALERLETALRTVGAERVAAVIAEPILGNGGIEAAPPEYWRRVRDLCDAHGILLIFDEVQTGMNRTGQWWACSSLGVTPDVLTTAKALGNGYPVAALATSDRVGASFSRPYAATFGGSPVGAAAALATIDFHQRHDLGRRATERGAQLLAGLREIASRRTWLRRPRGSGLMIGVDICDERGGEAPRRADRVLESLKDRGVLCGRAGPQRNVLIFMPPLTITAEQIARCVGTLEEVCHAPDC